MPTCDGRNLLTSQVLDRSKAVELQARPENNYSSCHDVAMDEDPNSARWMLIPTKHIEMVGDL